MDAGAALHLGEADPQLTPELPRAQEEAAASVSSFREETVF